MKYIFDFDDVLFNNTAQFKTHMFNVIAKAGVPEEQARAYYLEVREKEFSLLDFITTLFLKNKIKNPKINDVYEEIMKESPNFVNTELINQVTKLGKENCYIVTNGEKKFNQDKINYSEIGYLFKEIYIVPGSKKEAIQAICVENSNEEVVFVDDKVKFIEDIDLAKCPNLKTILWSPGMHI